MKKTTENHKYGTLSFFISFFLNKFDEHKNIWVISVLIILFSVFSHCGSVRKLDSQKYPVSNRTIFIHNFVNDTFQSDANIELTEALRTMIMRRKNFFVQKNQKDSRLMLYGEIIMYRKEGRMYDNYGEPSRFELMIMCRVKVRENNRLILDREFASSTDYSSSEGYVEMEYAARQRVYRKLAIQIASNLELAYISTRD